MLFVAVGQIQQDYLLTALGLTSIAIILTNKLK